jgi:hypothetical protein
VSVRLFLLMIGAGATTTGILLLTFGQPPLLPVAALAGGLYLIRHANNLEGGRL